MSATPRADAGSTTPRANAGVAYPDWAIGETSLTDLLEGLERRRRTTLAKRDPIELADILGSVGERFTKAGPLRQAALDALVQEPGYSPAMAAAVLDGMAREWCADHLRKLVVSEMLTRASESSDTGEGAGSTWTARSPAVHLCSGNVPGVSVTSLIRGLLVGSALIVKPGRSDCALPVLFYRALKEVAPDIAAAAAVHYWPPEGSGGVDVAGRAALLVVYGGNEAIRWARRSAGPATHLVEYPHRVSVLLVTPDALESEAVQAGARSAARAVALFEQRGCVSPQAIYVVQREGGAAEAWGGRLAAELEHLEVELPPGRRTAGEASAFHQEAGSVEMAAAAGSGTRVWGAGTGWRVVYEAEGGFSPSCLGRFVRVYSTPSFDEAVRELGRLAPQLQTVGIVGSIDTEQRARLAEAGALRVTGVEDVPWPPAWARLDGIEPLRSLVRWWDCD